MATNTQRIKLRDGYEVSQTTLDTVLPKLRNLWDASASDFSTLVQKCKNTMYRIPSKREGGNSLEKYGLVDETGHVNNETRAIVLNCIEGEGFAMRLVDPIDPNKVIRYK